MFGIVLNPVSGGGRGKKLGEAAVRLLQERGLACRTYVSTGEGGIGEQVRRALSEGCDAIVSAGGDGSLLETVREMAGKTAVLFLLPAGTGNDFVRAMKLPKDPMDAFRAQLDGKPARVDCGLLNGRPFLNVSGTGLDTEVLRRTEELKSVYPGEKAYRKAVMDVVRNYRPCVSELTVDGKDLGKVAYTIIEAANGNYIGGGMKVAPGALADDGLLDLVIVKPVPKALIPLLFPLFIAGWHVHLPLAKEIRARSITLKGKNTVVNIDGQLETMDTVHWEILPGALRIMRPDAG